MTKESIVYLLWSDLVGVTRTRGVPTADFDSRLETGLGWACAGQALTAFDSIVDNPWGPMDEARQIPDPAARFSYRSAVTGSEWEAVICDSKAAPDRDWSCCTRSFYRRALAALEAEAGLTIAASFEHEFLLQAEGKVEAGFSFAAARRGNEFLKACCAALRTSGVVPETLEPEYGAAQYEISCAPKIGVAAADAGLIAREIIRAVAVDFGMQASFTPKPEPKSVGNGAHIHFSLVKSDNHKNVTYDRSGPLGLSKAAASFCAGILAHLDALTAITAPTPISYYRLRPHSWSCGFKSIGVQNREAALRVTPSASLDADRRARAFNVEYRPADGCASPYLTLGVLVLAGLSGIRRKMKLPKPLDRDPADLSEAERKADGITALPSSLEEALAALAADAEVKSWFAPELFDVYTRLKQWECGEAKKNDEATLFARYRAAY